MKAPHDGFSTKEYPGGSITQYFGENPSLYARMNMDGHNGIDSVAPHGSPLYAIESGTVCDVKYDKDGYGKHLRIITDGENARVWTYGHCNAITVEVGDRVEEGDLVATMGNTGFVVSGSTPFWNFNPFAGTHLHLGLRLVRRDPSGWSYPGSDIKMKVINFNNGYKGAIDPLPLIKDLHSDFLPPIEEKKTILNGIISLLQKIISKQS